MQPNSLQMPCAQAAHNRRKNLNQDLASFFNDGGKVTQVAFGQSGIKKGSPSLRQKAVHQHWAKLTPKKIKTIRQAFIGISNPDLLVHLSKQLAERYNVTYQTIRSIRIGDTWRDA